MSLPIKKNDHQSIAPNVKSDGIEICPLKRGFINDLAVIKCYFSELKLIQVWFLSFLTNFNPKYLVIIVKRCTFAAPNCNELNKIIK
jgi:hypothetical protein